MKAFYADILGCNVKQDQAYGDKRWVVLEFPNGFTVNLTTVPENMKPGTMKLFFTSPDVQNSQTELTAKGLKTVNEGDDWGKWENSDGKGAKWFEVADPDGNHVLIIPA